MSRFAIISVMCVTFNGRRLLVALRVSKSAHVGHSARMIVFRIEDILAFIALSKVDLLRHPPY